VGASSLSCATPPLLLRWGDSRHAGPYTTACRITTRLPGAPYVAGRWDGLLRSAVGRQTTDYWDGSEAPGSLSGRTPWLCAAEASCPVTVLELVDALIAVSAVPAELVTVY
jgi:hypothetical protein